MKFTHFKLHPGLYLLLFLTAATALVIVSCASQEAVFTPGMTPEDFFQRAQDASDRGNFPLALKYYYKFKETFPDNLEKNVWASYEIAFLQHKMGNDATALQLLDEVIALYSQDRGSVLPKAVKALAENVKQRILNSQKQPEAPVAAPAATPKPAASPAPAR
jgi:tetratricopeptide (TPR) repeat protein